MEFSWNKLRNFLIFFFILLISFLLSRSIFYWLKSIDANHNLQLTISVIVFLTVFFGLWVFANFIRIFLFQYRGVKGYQLRGKLTFYFLVVAVGGVMLVGGLMVYYTSLVERNFIANGNRIFSDLMGGYKQFMEGEKEQFEKKLEKSLRQGWKPNILFEIRGKTIVFLKGDKIEISDKIRKEKDSIINYFARNNLASFYFGKDRNIFLKKYKNQILAVPVPQKLANTFLVLWKNSERYAGLNMLRNYVVPISIVSLVVFSVPIFIGVFFISIFLAKSITGNIEAIAKGTRLIAKGDLEYRVKVQSGDELEDLADNFNLMATRLKRASEQVKRVERLEAWQEMAKRLAHEVKNPLTPIKLSAERLLFAYEFKAKQFPGILDKTTTTIINETKRLELLVNEFSGFARLPYLKLKKREIVSLLQEISDFFKGAYPNLEIKTYFPDEPLYVNVDENQIKQVIINIISNAIEALPEPANHVSIHGKVMENSFRLSVKDTAGGIDSDLKDKIFEPYFTTKAKGTGLGLAIAERIILEHNGNIWFETNEIGTEFNIELPIISQEKQNAVSNKKV